jgi:hypothetical protein
MELIYFFIGIEVFCIGCWIWGYFDHKKDMRKDK